MMFIRQIDNTSVQILINNLDFDNINTTDPVVVGNNNLKELQIILLIITFSMSFQHPTSAY